MTDYYFISSPLHFCLSANIALHSQAQRRVALIMTRDRVAADAYFSAIGKRPEVFSSVVSLSHSAHGQAGLSRKETVRLLRKIFSEPGQARIFTGNDRRYEFQCAMHIAVRNSADVEGIYLDDGAVSYVGHKSLDKVSHRYIDPLVKKLLRGWWWKNSLTTGASGWITSAYVAFPEAVHPLLRGKRLLPIDAAGFRLDSYRALISELVADSGDLRERLAGIRVIVTLPHEAGFLKKQEVYARVYEALIECFSCGEIAVKAHPRAKNLDSAAKCFPGCLLLDSRVGMEFMLPLLREDCLVLGDISTALLTSKWLRPELAVIALQVFGEPPEKLLKLFDKLHVELSAPEQLSERLRLLSKAC